MKKKTLCALLAFVLCVSPAPAGALASEEAGTPLPVEDEAVFTETPLPNEAFTPLWDGAASGTLGENITWTFSDEGVLTISGTGPMIDQGVYEHVWPAETYALPIREVIIEEGVTSIGANAFNGYYQLAKVTLPSSLGSIGANAFANDSKLTELVIPDGVTTIGDSAFQGCWGLQTLNLPKSLKTIGDNAFANCGSLIGAVLPDGLESIGYGAFSQCRIESVTIPGSLKVIEEYSFSRSSIRELVISEGVEEIGERAFMNCTMLQSVTIPDSVTTLGYGVFSGSGIQSVIIGKGVDRISGMLFSGCFSLSEVTFSGSVDIIENNAFDNCLKLASITLPSGVRTIGSEAFKNCIALTELALPTGLESIGRSAFYRCIVLPEIDLPKGLKTIEQNAFESCENLARLSLPSSIESIGQAAFSHCFTLSDAVYAGTEEKWQNVSVGTDNAYLWNALGFTAITGGTTEYGIEWSIEDGVLTLSGDGWLTPDNSWASYADIVSSIVIGEGFTDITHDCFAGFRQAESISLPASLTAVDTKAFSDCTRLQEVTYPGTRDQFYAIVIDTGNEPLWKAAPFPYHGSGTIDGFSWDFTDGVFTLTGSGTVENTMHLYLPYRSFMAETVTKIVFGEGITEIQEVPCGFTPLVLREICLPKSLTYVAWQTWSGLRYDHGTVVTYAGTREEFFKIVFREGNGALILCYDPTVSLNVEDYNVERSWTETVYDGTLKTYSDDELRVVSADGHVLIPGVDYTLYHFDCVDPGTAGVDIIGRRCYTGMQTVYYTILPDGEWRTTDGVTYYFIDDEPVTGWLGIGSDRYYFSETDGAMQTGWQKIDGERYYFGETGMMQTGLLDIGSDRYYFSEDGVMQTGWQTIGDERLYFDPETGIYSEGLPWTISEDGVLTVSGEGPMILPYGWSWDNRYQTIRSIVVEDGVTSIGASAFYGCGNVESISIPVSVQAIGEGAFGTCASLTKLDLPDGIAAIPAHMCEGCSSLERVSLPASVKSVGFNAFDACPSLKTVDYEGTDEQWNIVSIEKNNAALVFACLGEVSGENNDGITWILSGDGTLTVSGEGAIMSRSDEGPDFAWREYYQQVRRIVVSEGITEISAWAFSNLAWAESAALPESLSRIGNGAFSYLSALKTVEYGGTREQWDAIDLDENNNDLVSAYFRTIYTPADAAALLAEGDAAGAATLLQRLVGIGGHSDLF